MKVIEHGAKAAPAVDPASDSDDEGEMVD
jgi:hypothetical protein